MARRLTARVRAALVVALSAACSPSKGDGPVTVDVSGAEGEPIAASNALDILVVDVTVDGVRGTAVVDTGSPIVALDPSAFAGARLPAGAGAVSTLALGSLTFATPPVVGADLITSPDPALPIDGSLGCRILCAFPVTLDYRGSTVTLGAAPLPSAVAPPVTAPFTLLGGGDTTLAGVPGQVSFPPSRVPVTVSLEGHTYTFILDTGSSVVLLREALFTSLVADGRARLNGVGAAMPGGSSSSSVTRARALAVAGAEVSGLVVSADTALEPALDGVAAETGESVDGLLGGSFLREFLLTIDYPHGELELRRYVTGGPSFDLFDRVGVSAAPPGMGSSAATVTHVFSGTHAESLGVRVGDAILSIDGTPVRGLGATTLDELLSGPVGATKRVTFGAAATASLAHKTVVIGVDDVLPL